MKITIFGAGYVGLVTGTCFAELGNQVTCVDVNKERITQLQKGHCPIHEPDLPELIESNVKAGRLYFTDDIKTAVQESFYHFIAVGTPQDEDGSADLQYVLAVATSIGEHMNAPCVVVTKSTVPVGTAEKVKNAVQAALDKRKAHFEFDVASNPEFLREGAAISDFMNSDRIIIGTNHPQTEKHLKALYTPFNRNGDRLIAMDVRSAEFTKYAANSMLATKISFMNEMSQLAERMQVDIEKVRIGIGSDPRIGYHFINPGCGFGGSCFPKDLAALATAAHAADYDSKILKAVQQVNQNQKLVLAHKIQHHFGLDLKGKTIAIWGLAFKPHTDDMREASSRTLMELLWKAGARVQAYDPVAMPEARRIYSDRADLTLCPTAEDALKNADALAVVTEWSTFLSPDFALIKKELKQAVIFDGRNLYDPHYLAQLGFAYYGIGRGVSIYT